MISLKTKVIQQYRTKLLGTELDLSDTVFLLVPVCYITLHNWWINVITWRTLLLFKYRFIILHNYIKQSEILPVISSTLSNDWVATLRTLLFRESSAYLSDLSRAAETNNRQCDPESSNHIQCLLETSIFCIYTNLKQKCFVVTHSLLIVLHR